MPHGGEIGAERRAADLVQRSRQRPLRRRRDDAFECGENPLPVGLTEWYQSHAGGNPVRGQRMQKCAERRFARDVMPGTGDADGYRQRYRARPRILKARERRARPRGFGRIEEGSALRRCFEEALLGRDKCRRKRRNIPQRRVIAPGNGAVGMNEQNRVAETAAYTEHRREPLPQGLGILDIAGLDRPLDAA